MISCCFIGHRNAELVAEEVVKLKSVIINLINRGVKTFLFGSKSKFDDLCYEIVFDLQQKFSDIKLIGYPCGSEHFCLKSEKETEQIVSRLLKRNIKFKFYDAIVENNYIGKGSYILRNKKMIDDCDVCIFYYDVDYKFATRSGTKVCFDYAKHKKKEIFNIKL